MAEENLSKASIHIRVWGRVQGVGFRAYVAQKASLLGINGWVRNVGHDQVETRAEGDRKDLERFLAEVKKGPSVSDIRENKVEWGVFRGEFKKFCVRWF
jgi:acylphosphatase